MRLGLPHRAERLAAIPLGARSRTERDPAQWFGSGPFDAPRVGNSGSPNRRAAVIRSRSGAVSRMAVLRFATRLSKQVEGKP